jgi:hypothetical protein
MCDPLPQSQQLSVKEVRYEQRPFLPKLMVERDVDAVSLWPVSLDLVVVRILVEQRSQTCEKRRVVSLEKVQAEVLEAGLFCEYVPASAICFSVTFAKMPSTMLGGRETNLTTSAYLPHSRYLSSIETIRPLVDMLAFFASASSFLM